MRAVWVFLGCLATGCAFVGAVLPLVPTVPFLLLAAFCFARGSERLHRWLMEHRLFGPMIRDWRRHRVIRRRAKWAATASIAAALGLSLALGAGPVVLGVQAAVLSLTLLFIWSRPDAPPLTDQRLRRRT